MLAIYTPVCHKPVSKNATLFELLYSFWYSYCHYNKNTGEYLKISGKMHFRKDAQYSRRG